jgi:hypothetical protein
MKSKTITLTKKGKIRKTLPSLFTARDFCRPCDKYYDKDYCLRFGRTSYKYCVVCKTRLRCILRKRSSPYWEQQNASRVYY